MIEDTLVAGKYRIKRRIGAGGMGAVYEGEHVEIGKRVAIKVIEQQHARSDELAARFRREARAASAVESEHIVHVFDVGHDDTVGLYMVMEFLVGEDLSSRLEKAGGRIPVEEAITIATQAARALGKAHAAGVVHRDLKPANLFLTTREDGSVSVKILDFGISKLIRPGSDAKSSNLTREGSVMGTPTYMSPEQAQGLPVDARSDIWSLASVLYEALSGQTPFAPRDTYEQMIVQIVTQRPKPLRDVAAWVPEPIARLVDAALVDVATRPSDAGAFAKQLAAAAALPADTASGFDLTVLASTTGPASDPSSSSSRLVASSPESSARSGAASPPTGTGVVVGARTQLDAGLPRKRSAGVLLGAGVVAVAVLVGVIALATREPATKSAAQGGLVAAPPSETASAPLPNASSAVVTTILPAASVVPEPSAQPSVKAASPTATASDAGARPGTRPGTGAVPPTTTTKGGPSQYGAAGVSTAY
ncbi:MAG: Serine/threonine protein kinase [Labilithrix sp.]|nr:Serine/threonine protein kinase [Labilithrix sp.]